MRLLTRCCCCFSLKYGYLTYGIIGMASRLIGCIGFYLSLRITLDAIANSTSKQEIVSQMFPVLSCYGGWIITSVFCLFFALQGIVQKRFMLLYPYIVIVAVELVGTIIGGIVLAIYTTSYYLIILPFAAAIAIYDLWSLISLFLYMKMKKETNYPSNQFDCSKTLALAKSV